ncbi:tyrosine-protein phosphatase [Clavibacter lycopersici]|uniref:Tyrosine-protein phosphatase n=1 Tax=Clavibacter lycopersici TaxID=2301718 RepID=A0A399STA2_9MICO|nr:tyrosine-protein phosphatase [Clavibacter lycopersici]RIJ47286.1 tyrosine-protein phosphatase [Clavibacter lycopersici]RIJ59415.1 tyrosine-protein phosphatase [Clavibacter lycopersici]
MTASDRAIPIDGLVNARDLGGIRLRSGGATPTGALARCEDADLITDTGWERLRELGYRTVLDLRQPAERARDTHPRPDWIHVTHVDLDGLDDHPDFWVPYWDTGLVGTPLYYLPHLAELPDRAGSALRAILEAPAGGVLFHCGAGRDRTGLVALLLLLAVGAEPDEIVDDYLESIRLGRERSANTGQQDLEPAIAEFLAERGTTSEAAFREAMAGIDLDRFLDAAGFADADRRALRTWRGAIPD